MIGHETRRREIIDEALAANKDPHAAVAAWEFGIDVSEVTKLQRQHAKVGNFVYLYSSRGTLGTATGRRPTRPVMQELPDTAKRRNVLLQSVQADETRARLIEALKASGANVDRDLVTFEGLDFAEIEARLLGELYG